jgi:hypothetical protein
MGLLLAASVPQALQAAPGPAVRQSFSCISAEAPSLLLGAGHCAAQVGSTFPSAPTPHAPSHDM